MIGLSLLPLCYGSIAHSESLGATKIPLKNWAWKIARIINNSTAHCPIGFKSDTLLCNGPRGRQSCEIPLPVKPKCRTASKLDKFIFKSK